MMGGFTGVLHNTSWQTAVAKAISSTLFAAAGSASGPTTRGFASAASMQFASLHPNPTGPCAFSFDIDGVLIRGKRVLDATKKAMGKLCPSGRWLYPTVFMTNGGGMLEADKAKQLSGWFNVPVATDQVIMSHTPMKALAQRLGDQPVLISGRRNVLNVAKSYGFKRCLTTLQLAAAMPSSTPFISQHALPPGQEGDPVATEGLATEAAPISAVLVMTDPENWYLDLQVITDVVSSQGVPTRPDDYTGERADLAGSKPVEVFFSNPDLLWANDHPRSRYGQGAFAHTVLSLYELYRGGIDFPVRFFGKPNPEPYRLAEKLLVQQALQMGLIGSGSVQPGTSDMDMHSRVVEEQVGSCDHSTYSSSDGPSSRTAAPFSGIYAVGDNPAADVRGANRAGPPWVSVLVRSGVFKGSGNCSTDPARIVVDDVANAVEAALHHTRNLRFHSMR